jgi:Cdc6-like AAA superfamily ATPase
MNKFLVIDTEGSDTLTEIAIINDQGDLIYEAYVANPDNKFTLKAKSLTNIIEDLQQILPNQTIICHSAKHDQKILSNTFRKYNQNLPRVNFICTVELAKQIYPNLSSYSLKNLSKKLLLQVNNQFFREVSAHKARYDAEFTFQLYLHCLQAMNTTPNQSEIKTNTANPFNSNRVDNPFQDHLDFEHIYQQEFNYLCSVVQEIKTDTNQQSKAALIIGEAGSGKTHLIMRLAKATLKTNRLLYIRQPNNPDSVVHHIYSRILESFAQKVNLKDTTRTQLDLLLARSFTNILKQIEKGDNTQKLKTIINALDNDSLSLYERLGSEGTQRHGDNWRYIATKISQWWSNNYSAGGYGPNILQGIIKFCSYKDNPSGGINYKDQVRRWLAGSELDLDTCEKIGLNNWREDLSQEDFALEAISLFGQLSTLDEPLIIVFDQLESLIHNPAILISFGNAVREILTHVPNSLIIVNLFPDRWDKFQQYFDASVSDRLSQHFITLQRPSNQELEQILRLKSEAVGVKLEQIFTKTEINAILQEPSIRKVINKASNYFRCKTQNLILPDNINDNSQNEIETYQTMTVEQKLAQLENTIKQIANACLPIIQGLSSTTNLVNLPTVIEQNSEIAETAKTQEKETISEAKKAQDTKPEPDNKLKRDYEQVISYLKENYQFLADEYDNPHIITDDDDWGKLVQIIQAFKIYDFTLKSDQLNLGKKTLPNHLLIINDQGQYVIGFLNVSGAGFTARIKNFNQLVSSHHQIKFILLRDKRENPITGKVGLQEIDKLNYTKNGELIIMDRRNRIVFELIYKMIIDINQSDLEVEMETAIATFITEYNDYWLIKLLFS